jgi:hypothetical protein
MQSTQIEEIKAALWEQAFYGCTQVSCPMGQVCRLTHKFAKTGGYASEVKTGEFMGQRNTSMKWPPD